MRKQFADDMKRIAAPDIRWPAQRTYSNETTRGPDERITAGLGAVIPALSIGSNPQTLQPFFRQG